MSLLKLAALGAEVLDILDCSEEWNSETFDIIKARIEGLGLADSDDEGMFRVCTEHKNAAFHLLEDYEQAVKEEQVLYLEIRTAGQRQAVFYPGESVGEPSAVTIPIGKNHYEL